MAIAADGLSGIPRETVDLVVTEVLNLLGIGDAEIRIDEN
jgi:hypothetical protein